MGDTNLLYARRLISCARGCVSGMLCKSIHILNAFRMCRSAIVGRLASNSATAVPTVRKHPFTACPPILCTRMSILSTLALLACIHTDDA
jgi:hypothetical protein